MDSPATAVLDTNVLVRYLTADDPAKARAVDSLLGKAGRGELKILVPSIVIAELVWVLESFYSLERKDIAELIHAVLNTPGVEVTDRAMVTAALRTYKQGKIDLIDAWIMEFARSEGIRTVYSFDKRHFKDDADIAVKTP